MAIFSIIITVLYFIDSIFCFRFQRVTLAVSRKLKESEDTYRNKKTNKLQSFMTPTWLGALGWLSTLLLIAAFFLIFVAFGWMWALGVVLYAFVGGAIVDVITPIPSYQYCLELAQKEIRKSLAGSIINAASSDQAFLLLRLSKQIENFKNNIPVYQRYF
ncbi:hypothetical protein A3B61_00310 [Candidatus Peribacteria bacterium RIFCSPLOWO2_01_FULL_53_10]|nr:MAG: hypothetical protein A3B61_00310 [Candidatus Peribacteria bacterium RIFCSPLOWO2_01_FULL_53_10]